MQVCAMTAINQLSDKGSGTKKLRDLLPYCLSQENDTGWKMYRTLLVSVSPQSSEALVSACSAAFRKGQGWKSEQRKTLKA